ncbi:MAG TPA: HEAT repeat domain-containing protein [Planctomycetota bacterium]|nr:HEAT repeat domain-containing protein [Planctomycetota bacterium]
MLRSVPLALLLTIGTLAAAADPPVTAASLLAPLADGAEIDGDALARRGSELPPEERIALAAGIAKKRLAAGRTFVVDRLRDGAPAVRIAALDALIKLGGDASAVETLIAVAQRDDAPRARMLGVMALAASSDATAVPAIARCLADADPEVAKSAHIALCEMTRVDLGTAAEAWLRWHDERELEANDLLPRLAAQLQDKDPGRVRLAIARLALYRERRDEAVELLNPVVQHDDAQIGALAATALKKLGAPVPQRLVVDGEARPLQRSLVTGAASLIAGRPLSESLSSLIAGALLLGVIGGIALMVFLMRTREVAAKVAKGMTRRMVKGAKDATRVIRKKITFTS